MQPRLFRAYRMLFGILLALGLAAVPAVGIADSGPTFSGQATAVKGQLLNGTIPVLLSDTGFQDSGGFAEHQSGPTATVADPASGATLLSVETLHATTIGQGDRSRSEASVASVNLNVAGQNVQASFLMARAMAVCTSSGPVLSGSSELAQLQINGTTYDLGTAPNQSLTVGDVTVYTNQQSQSGNSIDVTALHVVVSDPLLGNLADVSFASVHADVLCGSSPNCSSARDFVTGGGWIIPQTGSDKANFAVAGGYKNGLGWGHLEYIDHNTGTKIHGNQVTMYMVTGLTSRRIEGVADMNGQLVNYTVDVDDKGEPGKGQDSFTITAFDAKTNQQVYPQPSSDLAAAGGLLGGGNIQLHQPCQ